MKMVGISYVNYFYLWKTLAFLYFLYAIILCFLLFYLFHQVLGSNLLRIELIRKLIQKQKNIYDEQNVNPNLKWEMIKSVVCDNFVLPPFLSFSSSTRFQSPPHINGFSLKLSISSINDSGNNVFFPNIEYG
jgi:hypothetical protein